ncbi:MAG TPA: NTP transferase domain-containing protein [Caulobacteraceae bacterium]|nr:NTP transferase domain-containing protein [Caulobacteraceae bacterium]
MTETSTSGGDAHAGVKGLIVAAGEGTRIRDIALSKPLAEVRGVALIESVIASAHEAGLREFVVVTGYEAERVEAFLQGLSARRGFRIETVRNPDWKRANGLSVVAAEALLGDRFVLLMSDHLFDPMILSGLLEQSPDREGVTLAVDRRLQNDLVDLEDVTRVATSPEGDIVRIGKLIPTYDAFDTGIFLASKALIAAIREDVEAGGNGGISAGMQILADRGHAHTHDIGARFWLDVDDKVAFGHAERAAA